MSTARFYAIALPIGLVFWIILMVTVFWLSNREAPVPEAQRHIQSAHCPTSGNDLNGQAVFLPFQKRQECAGEVGKSDRASSLQAARDTTRNSTIVIVEAQEGATLIITPEKTDLYNRDGQVTTVHHIYSNGRAAGQASTNPANRYADTHPVPPQRKSRVHHPEHSAEHGDTKSNPAHPIHSSPACSCQDGAACSCD